MKKLSIIIPYHNEDEDLLNPLFSSLNDQLLIDFNDVEIVMSNNCEYPKDLTRVFNKYPNLIPIINYIECPEKSGMGPNRQFGLENATGEYVMFCDCDDVLYSAISLHTIFHVLTPDIDMYDFIAIKELDPRNAKPGEAIFEINGPNPVLLHGKVYNRQYLIDHNIRFTSRLFAWEDMYFNQIIEQNKPNREFFNIPIYIWKFRASSVSKELGPEIVYQTKHYRDGILKNFYILDYLKKYNVVSEAKFNSILVSTTFSWYKDKNALLYQTEQTEMLYGYIIKYFDPELQWVTHPSLQVPGQLGAETYHEFINRITSNLDMEAIDAEYQIGHIEDCNYINTAEEE
jgi:glycosyltransferase involved in cell wall biosynthesis